MRIKLKHLEESRLRFKGTFSKYGLKSGYKGKSDVTILMLDIKSVPNNDEENIKEEILTDHAWFNYTKQFQSLDLHSGDILEFDARVKPYQKGYSEFSDDNPFRIDYKLSHPYKIVKKGISENYEDFTEYNKSILDKVKKEIEDYQKRIQEYKLRNQNGIKEIEFINNPKQKEHCNQSSSGELHYKQKSIIDFI